MFQHSGTKGLGENLAYTYSSSAPNLNNCGAYASTFVKNWYNEIKDYNFNSPGFTSGINIYFFFSFYLYFFLLFMKLLVTLHK